MKNLMLIISFVFVLAFSSVIIDSSVCNAQGYYVDSATAVKIINIRHQRDSLKLVTNKQSIDLIQQDTIIKAQQGRLASKDIEIKVLNEMKFMLQNRVNELQNQPKEVIKESKFTFLEILDYTLGIAIISFVSGFLAK